MAAVVVELCPTLCDPCTAACQASLSFTVMDSFPAELPCKPLSPGVCANSRPLSQWCNLIISSSVVPFSFCLPPFPIWVGFSPQVAKVLELQHQSYIQGWFTLGLTSLLSLLSKGLSRVFFSTIIQKHQIFRAQPSLWSNSHICTWLLEKP